MHTRSRIAASSLAAALLTVALAAPAGATEDQLLLANIVYAHPQVEGYCYGKAPVSTMYGIPYAVLADASLRPALALSLRDVAAPGTIQVAGGEYVNINVLAQDALVGHSYVSDSVTSGGAIEYRAELDLTAVAQHYGDSLDGRRATITRAKLALLAVAKNLKDVGGLYRLFATFKGLPSQTGLSGTPVYAQSQYAYSGGSPVLQAYEQELIAGSDCPGPAQSALYGQGKADGEGEAQPGSSSAGCAAAGASGVPSASLAGLLVALLGVAIALRFGRRR